MFQRILIANRGAIATRIARTLGRLGIHSIGVYAASDRSSTHLSSVDEAWSLGDGRAAETYLDSDKLLDVIERSGAQAVHPGYGFLSENPHFAARLEERGITFIGPSPDHIRQFGLKHEARALALRAGVNVLPGSELLRDVDDALAGATHIGYPVMLKSTAGGGGIGMQRCNDAAQLRAAFDRVQRLALANFGNAELYLEKLIVRPRHVEVQAFGDGEGGVLTIGDRDCSLQRRHQKVIEECPAPGLPAEVRSAMHAQSRALLASVRYRNAATVEFLYDSKAQAFYFLEVNTRLQVEHGVTELVFDVDLVEWMVRLAAGELPALSQLPPLKADGHAVQARIYAEDPNHDFRPTPGVVSHVAFPDDAALRVDTWLRPGTEVSPWFDPLLAKIMAKGSSRDEALVTLRNALRQTTLFGIETNREYLVAALQLADFTAATMHTASLAGLAWQPATFDVLEPGAATTVQSFPGRQGFWAVGMPPSGPMDDLSFRIGNALLENDSDAAGLEVVLRGPVLRFNTDVSCVVTGAPAVVSVDTRSVPAWQTFTVERGQTLTIGTLEGGARAYLLVRGGIKIPPTMGSSATFTLGHIGGQQGRALLSGDTLHVEAGTRSTQRALPAGNRPDYGSRRLIRVMLGPHAAPDFFTRQDITTFLQSTWTVHYNSSRTGIRLTGPQPQWARDDGGEAGLHPSNIHDNAYAFGSVDFTGDMPVILGPDGPSLGGFVCPAVVINADRWKLGQLGAGDEIRFVAVSEADASKALAEHEAGIENCCVPTEPVPAESVDMTVLENPVVFGTSNARDSDVVIRRAGQEWLLVEFGPNVLDIELHLKVHVLSALIRSAAIPGIVEMTPGIRSLQIRYDIARWRSATLVAELQPLLAQIEHADEQAIASRTVWLPLSWDDPACRDAIARYVRGVRSNAPWCPDNIEFIRRINGLASADEVKRIVFDASYLVMGLGDVYLGAPVATPLDPRHRLVTTKYNPARTWTAENSVGIGGSYLCIYGMEGPGGYQFVGRTLQVWNQHRIGAAFDEYWLLRPFDQIRFYEVEAAHLLDLRDDFSRGAHDVHIEHHQWELAGYRQFLHANRAEIDRFSSTRQTAFNEELARWRRDGLLSYETAVAAEPGAVDAPLGDGAVALNSPISGAVWSIRATAPGPVEEGDVVIVLEAMKTEFEITANASGELDLLVAEGQLVTSGQRLAVITR